MNPSSEHQADLARLVTILIAHVEARAARLRIQDDVDAAIFDQLDVVAQLLERIARETQDQFDRGDSSTVILYRMMAVLQEMDFDLDWEEFKDEIESL